MKEPVGTTAETLEKSEIEQIFDDFAQTRFYKWCERVLVGPYHFLVLPLTGFLDAFLVIIPTEIVVAAYAVKQRTYSTLFLTLTTTFFAIFGYVILYYLVFIFGQPVVDWFTVFVGEDVALGVDGFFTDYVWLLALGAGLTSLVPMPMTAFALVAGLLGLPVVSFFIGGFIGKGIRFGAIIYLARTYGEQAWQIFLRYSNAISATLLALLLLYYFFIQ